MSMNRKDPTEALAEHRGDAITITTEQCIRAWREAVPGAIDDPTHIDIVGAMGSASSIALGIALAQPSRKVIVMDGDGSLLMQLGSLVTIAGAAPEHLYHCVVENCVYAT
jgi:thiamine pyrophosphate-dependent acetolactate synthase large subunit-like protein